MSDKRVLSEQRCFSSEADAALNFLRFWCTYNTTLTSWKSLLFLLLKSMLREWVVSGLSFNWVDIDVGFD